MITAINGIIIKRTIISSDPDLLSGFTRIVPPTPTYTTSDDKIYLQQDRSGIFTSLGQTFTGDATILVKYNNTLNTNQFGVEIALSISTGDSDYSNYVGIYFRPDNEVSTEFGGSETLHGQMLTTRWYGLRKVSNNITAVYTTDGVTYTTLYDFGDRTGVNNLLGWGNLSAGGTILPNPQFKI